MLGGIVEPDGIEDPDVVVEPGGIFDGTCKTRQGIASLAESFSRADFWC